jgi:DNA-binding transcriptional LysR family regulator
MELRHLRYFLAVAESLHFGRAAQRLRIAQPSLSQQIRLLESELDTKLFERSKKRVTLTESGQLFLEESRLILEHADRAALNARTGKRRETGQVRVGFDYWIDWTKLGEAVRRFDKAHPTVHVQLFSMSSAQEIAALHEARIDVGLVRPPVSDPRLSSEDLLAESFVVALAENHRLAGHKRIALTALRDEPFITPERERLPTLYELTFRLFHDAGFVPKVHHEVDFPGMVLGLVGKGIGISLVPLSASSSAYPGVRFVRLQRSPPILETSLVWRREGAPPIVTAFLQTVLDVASPRRRITRATSVISHRSEPRQSGGVDSS